LKDEAQSCDIRVDWAEWAGVPCEPWDGCPAYEVRSVLRSRTGIFTLFHWAWRLEMADKIRKCHGRRRREEAKSSKERVDTSKIRADILYLRSTVETSDKY
jgi:hypothetical protein